MPSAKWLNPARLINASSLDAQRETHGINGELHTFKDFLPQNPGRNENLRKTIEAVAFSRRLAVYYNVTLAVVLLAFGAINWWHKWSNARGRKLRQHRRSLYAQANRNHKKTSRDASRTPSPSSSTLEGSEPLNAPGLIIEHRDERSPLVQRHPHKQAGQESSCSRYMLWCKLDSWLMYQPKPILFFNKTLPQNGLTFVIILFLALNVFVMVYQVPANQHLAFILADRCGNMFVANLPALYLLAAKNQPVKWITGHSYESLNIFHRRLGEIMCLEAFLHLLGMVAAWYIILLPLTGMTLWQYLSNTIVILGLSAFIAYEGIYITSLGSFRQAFYEMFLFLHVILQIIGLVLLWFHFRTTRPYVLIALSIFILDRIVARIYLRTEVKTVSLSVMEDGQTILVSANWDLPSAASPMMRGITIDTGWNPTDHVFITIPALSRFQTLQAHPFTIYSAAPEPHDPQISDADPPHAWLSLLIRARSGFSNSLLAHARTHANARARIDGPYGSSYALDLLLAADQAVLVAAGSGIAAVFPLLWHLLCSPQTDAERGTDPAGASRRSVHLLWVVHDRAHLAWLPSGRLDELRARGLEVVIPSPTRETGRPDVSEIVEDMVEVHGGVAKRVGVVVSGPDGLIRDARNSCAALVARGRRVGIIVEKFGW